VNAIKVALVIDSMLPITLDVVSQCEKRRLVICHGVNHHNVFLPRMGACPRPGFRRARQHVGSLIEPAQRGRLIG